MEKIEHGVEELIARTHEEEEWLVGVVETEQGILSLWDGFVRTFSEHVRRMKMNPVARNINQHNNLEEE